MAARARPPLTADDPRHGTQNGYGNYGCRCPPCTTAAADYHRQTVARHGSRPSPIRRPRPPTIARPQDQNEAQPAKTAMLLALDAGYSRGDRHPVPPNLLVWCQAIIDRVLDGDRHS